MKRKLKTEFKVEEQHTAILYVNDVKTNIWYVLPSHPYFNATGICNDVIKRQQAETVKLLIDTGQINGVKNWQLWDHCAFCEVLISEIVVVDKIPHENQIFSATGYENYLELEKQIEITDRLLGQKQSTQWTKRIIGNTLAHKVGIAFYQYGYTVGFIKSFPL